MISNAPTCQRSRPRQLLIAWFLTALLSACATGPLSQQPTPPPAPSSEAVDTLKAGIRLYEDGQYDLAAERLRDALKLGLRATPDLIQAHKHLAFILCATGKTEECADSFRAALKLDPSFQLRKAEAGHPMWGPVFVTVKKEQAR